MDRAIVDGLVKSAREAKKVDREREELFKVLIRHPGWVLYVELLNARKQMFSDQLLAPAGSVDGAVAQEYIKGALFGLVLATDLPQLTVIGMEQAESSGDEEAE